MAPEAKFKIKLEKLKKIAKIIINFYVYFCSIKPYSSQTGHNILIMSCRRPLSTSIDVNLRLLKNSKNDKT